MELKYLIKRTSGFPIEYDQKEYQASINKTRSFTKAFAIKTEYEKKYVPLYITVTDYAELGEMIFKLQQKHGELIVGSDYIEIYDDYRE